jgi:hypothetical protein
VELQGEGEQGQRQGQGQCQESATVLELLGSRHWPEQPSIWESELELELELVLLGSRRCQKQPAAVLESLALERSS